MSFSSNLFFIADGYSTAGSLKKSTKGWAILSNGHVHRQLWTAGVRLEDVWADGIPKLSDLAGKSTRSQQIEGTRMSV